MTPQAKLLRWLKAEGHVSAVCSWWNPFSKQRKDLFGLFDVVSSGFAPSLRYMSVRTRRICFWQVTSATNVSARKKKLEAARETLEALTDAQAYVHVVGFKKGSTEPAIWLWMYNGWKAVRAS